ncbi:MAG TPA: hypothetical protein VJK53_01630 [Candidatus Paceibacterota bacterium]
MRYHRPLIYLGLGLAAVVGVLVFVTKGQHASQVSSSIPESLSIATGQNDPTPTESNISSGSSIATEQDLTVKAILLKGSDGRYPDFTVPAGVVADPSTFISAVYNMKTVGRFYKDSQYLYWVVFPVPLYNLPFSITRVPNGDPATFHTIRVGGFDADAYAADKNQFYCGPFPFLEIDPADAKVVIEDGYPVVQANGKTYERTALDFSNLEGGATRPCAEVGPKGPGTAN